MHALSYAAFALIPIGFVLGWLWRTRPAQRPTLNVAIGVFVVIAVVGIALAVWDFAS